ncbi:MAG TPA: EMC3/TMCO1 family protein [Methanocorpusculum sp.]|nr:EMC3/TMCO1 family protein [Methanocorpusculum sp.]
MGFKEFWHKYGMFVSLAFMFALMFLYQWKELRAAIASIVDVVIAPFQAMGLPFFALVLILATITGTYSSLIQKYTINYDKMFENQEKTKEFNIKFREAQQSGDEKLIKKMQARQQQMMADQMEVTKQQFTPMIYILIVTIPIFFWLYENIPKEIDMANIMNTAIVLPFGGITAYFDVMWFIPAWLVWYMICSLCMTQIIRKALNIGGQ